MTAAEWVCFDGDCPLCVRSAGRFSRILERRGIRLIPLQTPWVRARLGNPESFSEMKFITRGNQVFGGAEAVAQIVRRIWWAWPVFVFSRFPGIMGLMEKYYRQVAANRSCAKDVCRVTKTKRHHRVFFELP